jgi:hypothetical protein
MDVLTWTSTVLVFWHVKSVEIMYNSEILGGKIFLTASWISLMLLFIVDYLHSTCIKNRAELLYLGYTKTISSIHSRSAFRLHSGRRPRTSILMKITFNVSSFTHFDEYTPDAICHSVKDRDTF